MTREELSRWLAAFEQNNSSLKALFGLANGRLMAAVLHLSKNQDNFGDRLVDYQGRLGAAEARLEAAEAELVTLRGDLERIASE